MRHLMLGLIFIFTGAFTSSAWADDHSDSPEDSAVEANLSPVDWARENDAMNDRSSAFLHHADTIGEGNTSFSAFYFVFMGFTHSPNEDFQFSVHTLPPIATDMPLILWASGKYILTRDSDSVMSVVLDSVYTKDGDVNGGVFRLGLSGDHFVGAKGRTSVHWNFSFLGGLGDASILNELDGQFFIGAAGVVHRISKKFSLLAETWLFGAHRDGEFYTTLDMDGTTFLPLVYGARFTSESLSAEVLFIKPVGVDSGPLVLGIPYIALGYRW